MSVELNSTVEIGLTELFSNIQAYDICKYEVCTPQFLEARGAQIPSPLKGPLNPGETKDIHLWTLPGSDWAWKWKSFKMSIKWRKLMLSFKTFGFFHEIRSDVLNALKGKGLVGLLMPYKALEMSLLVLQKKDAILGVHIVWYGGPLTWSMDK